MSQKLRVISTVVLHPFTSPIFFFVLDSSLLLPMVFFLSSEGKQRAVKQGTASRFSHSGPS